MLEEKQTQEQIKYGYVDISNLVYRTILGLFNKMPEVIELQKTKKYKELSVYKQESEDLKNKIVQTKGENFDKLLLSMCIEGFNSFRKQFDIPEENMLAFFDSKSWRKEKILDFYAEQKKEDESIVSKEYKAGRDKTYKDLIIMTINNIKNIFDELRINTFKMDNLEADDLIALIIKYKHNEPHMFNYIFTNDADFYQLQQQNKINPQNVIQFSPNIKEVISFSPLEAKTELEVKKILGDDSDNIPKITNFQLTTKEGIVNLPKIGDLTLRKMLAAYDIETKEGMNKVLNDYAYKIYVAQFTENILSKKTIKKLKESVKTPVGFMEEQELYTLLEEDLKTHETYSIEDIKNKLINQYNFNSMMVDFDNIPTQLKNDFEETFILSKQTKKGIIRKDIFLKYKLPNLANKVNLEEIDPEEEEYYKNYEAEEEQIQPITQAEIPSFEESNQKQKEEKQEFQQKIQIEKGEKFVKITKVEDLIIINYIKKITHTNKYIQYNEQDNSIIIQINFEQDLDYSNNIEKLQNQAINVYTHIINKVCLIEYKKPIQQPIKQQLEIPNF